VRISSQFFVKTRILRKERVRVRWFFVFLCVFVPLWQKITEYKAQEAAAQKIERLVKPSG